MVPPLWATLRISLGRTTPLGEVQGWTLNNYLNVFLNGTETLDLVTTSLVFAVGSSLLALALGGALAWVVTRTDMPGRSAIEMIVIANLAVPGLLIAISWLLLLSPRGTFSSIVSALGIKVSSLPGMIFVEGISQIPITFLLLKAMFLSQDSTMEEASQVSGVAPRTTLLFVTLPLALPGILSVLILNLVRTLEAFEIPAVIGLPGGVRTFVSRIYELTSGIPPRLGGAGVFSVLLIALLGLALTLNAWLLKNQRRFESVKGKSSRRTLLPLGRYRLLFTIASFVFVGFAFLLPMLMLLWVSLSPYYSVVSLGAIERVTLENFIGILELSSVQHAFLNSLRLAAVAATIVIVLSALVAWILVRTRTRLRPLFELLGNASLAVPGIVMGLTILTVYISVPGVYGTMWILVIAYVTAFLPYGLRYAQPALIQISQDMEDAAAICGVGWFQRFVSILVPLIKTALFGSWIYVFMLSFRELSRSVILYTAENNVISVELFNLWNNGNLPQVAAFSVLLMILLMPLGFFVRRVSDRSRYADTH